MIAVILFELSCGNGSVIEFDLCDLCDRENQDHNPKTNRLPQGHIGKQVSR